MPFLLIKYTLEKIIKHLSFKKIFVKLIIGKNEIILKNDQFTLKIILYYYPNETQINALRVLYVVCEDDDGCIPLLDSNDKISSHIAIEKINLGLKLIQTFLSEMILRQFGTRKTFKFYNETINCSNKDQDDLMICEYYKTKLKLKDALNMNQSELFIHLANEISNNLNIYLSNCKYVAVLSFTRYEIENNHETTIDNDIYLNTKGFCALGSEWLAVYGTKCLFTWPQYVNQIQDHFSNDTCLDKRLFISYDTQFSNLYYQSLSSSLGSLMHELCHIFDLGHNNTGIMSRGFDYFYEFFSINHNNYHCSCYNRFKVCRFRVCLSNYLEDGKLFLSIA